MEDLDDASPLRPRRRAAAPPSLPSSLVSIHPGPSPSPPPHFLGTRRRRHSLLEDGRSWPPRPLHHRPVRRPLHHLRSVPSPLLHPSAGALETSHQSSPSPSLLLDPSASRNAALPLPPPPQEPTIIITTMERIGLTFGNVALDLYAWFPEEPRGGTAPRRRGWQAPVRMRFRADSFLGLDNDGSVLRLRSFISFDSTVAGVATPHEARGIISYLLSQLDHPTPDPWAVRSLEAEMSDFSSRAAALAGRTLRSHGFYLVARIRVMWSLHPAALQGEQQVDVIPPFNLEDDAAAGATAEEPPWAVFVQAAEDIDGVLVLNPGQEEEEEEEEVQAGGQRDLRRGDHEIERLEMMRYRKDGDVGKEKESCTICLEVFEAEMEVVRMPCSHIFHTHCLLQWLEESRTCPLCRAAVPS